MTRDGRLHEKTTTGRTVSLGQVFSSEPTDYYRNTEVDGSSFTTADDQGIVLGDDQGHIRYVRFSRPGMVRTLADGLGTQQLSEAVDHHYAACAGANDTGDGPESVGAVLAPLDGSPATTATSARFGLGLSGDRLLWLEPDPKVRTYSLLHSLAAGAPNQETGSRRFGGAGPTAYGGLSLLDASVSHVIRATSANDVASLFTVPRSSASASVLALTPGRITDIDDRAGEPRHRPDQNSCERRRDDHNAVRARQRRRLNRKQRRQ
jgi:hypothetical protein